MIYLVRFIHIPEKKFKEFNKLGFIVRADHANVVAKTLGKNPLAFYALRVTINRILFS